MWTFVVFNKLLFKWITSEKNEQNLSSVALSSFKWYKIKFKYFVWKIVLYEPHAFCKLWKKIKLTWKPTFSKLFTDENSCLFLTKAKYYSGLFAFVTSVLF